jgi:hypothetical protein
VATSIYEVKYIALALIKKSWIWLINALMELNVPIAKATMYCHNKAVIDIAYNYEIANSSKYIIVPYDLGCENVESGQISLL